MLPSSTNPTLPYGINSQAELFDMIMVCHNLNPKIPSDVAFAESRVRAETIAAENVLHDIGVISMISSDSQAMGRVGENWLRAIQTADAMKTGRGKLPEDATGNDNFRVLRYVAKVTINPAITHGISHVLGSIAPGKMADLVLWEPAFFGAKPKLVHQGRRDQLGDHGRPERVAADAAADLSTGRCSGSSAARWPRPASRSSPAPRTTAGIEKRLGLAAPGRRGRRTRARSRKRDMVRNRATPKIEVNPETFAVTVDGSTRRSRR